MFLSGQMNNKIFEDKFEFLPPELSQAAYYGFRFWCVSFLSSPLDWVDFFRPKKSKEEIQFFQPFLVIDV